MSILSLNPFEIGNIGTISAWENDQEAKVNQMLDCFDDDRWVFITAQDIDNAIKYFDIDYFNLPQWLKDKIDEIEIV